MNDPIIPLSILALSFIYEIIGEPPKFIHPTVIMGMLESKIESLFRKFNFLSRKAGLVIWVSVVGTTALFSSFAVFYFKYVLPFFVFLIVLAFLLKTSYALITMDRHVIPIIRSLEKGDLENARKYTQRIVRRDTSNLNEQYICSAAIESIAEGMVDGFCSAIFFYSIFGIVGALSYRAINTMDSMIGYNFGEYRNFGYFSAKADTYTNYIIARIVAFLTVLSSFFIKLDYRESFRRILKEAKKTQSKNAGYPISAFSGALRVRLEKVGYYSIGLNDPLPSIEHVKRALILSKIVATLFVLIVAVPLILILGNWWMV